MQRAAVITRGPNKFWPAIGEPGDTPYDKLLLDLLLLTKMNWNTARYAERMPVTLEFADRVGDVLKEIGPDRTPESRYAFYM